MRTRIASSALAGTLAAALLLGVAAPAVAKKGKKSRQKACQIEGQVIDQAGARLSGVEVLIDAAGDAAVQRQTRSDEQGRFEVELPEGGNYQFALTKEGYGPYRTSLLIESGMRQQLEFRLVDDQAAARREAALAYNEGVQAFQAEDMATAKAKFLLARSKQPKMPEALLGLADIYFHDGENAAADEAITALLAVRPDHPQGLRLAYRLALRREGTAERTQLIERLTALEATAGLAADAYNQGVAAVQADDIDRAILLLRESSELDPTLAQPLETLATLLFNRGQYDQALAMAERLVLQAPQSEPGFRIRYLARDARQDAATLEAFDDYLAVAPEAAIGMLYRRAEMDFRSGALEPAKAALSHLLELRPEMADAHYTLGLCHSSAGETGPARRHLERFLELAPGHPEAASAREILSYF